MAPDFSQKPARIRCESELVRLDPTFLKSFLGDMPAHDPAHPIPGDKTKHQTFLYCRLCPLTCQVWWHFPNQGPYETENSLTFA